MNSKEQYNKNERHLKQCRRRYNISDSQRKPPDKQSTNHIFSSFPRGVSMSNAPSPSGKHSSGTTNPMGKRNNQYPIGSISASKRLAALTGVVVKETFSAWT